MFNLTPTFIANCSIYVFVFSCQSCQSQNKMGCFTVFILCCRKIEYQRNHLWCFSTGEGVELPSSVYFMAVNLYRFPGLFILNTTPWLAPHSMERFCSSRPVLTAECPVRVSAPHQQCWTPSYLLTESECKPPCCPVCRRTSQF